jgi:hypothetical protein
MICAKTQSAGGLGVWLGLGLGDGLVSDGLGLEVEVDGLGLGLELVLDGLGLGLVLVGLGLGLVLEELGLGLVGLALVGLVLELVEGLGLLECERWLAGVIRTARTAAAAPPLHGDCGDLAVAARAGAAATPQSRKTPPTIAVAARTACATGVRLTVLRWLIQLKLIRLS